MECVLECRVTFCLPFRPEEFRMSVITDGKVKKNSRSLRVLFSCSKCPAYCCSYDRVDVTRRDLLRIAKHFGISYKQAERRHTKPSIDGPILRHKKDHIFRKVCAFLDTENRQCTIYDARPAVCRTWRKHERRCRPVDTWTAKCGLDRRHRRTIIQPSATAAGVVIWKNRGRQIRQGQRTKFPIRFKQAT